MGELCTIRDGNQRQRLSNRITIFYGTVNSQNEETLVETGIPSRSVKS